MIELDIQNVTDLGNIMKLINEVCHVQPDIKFPLKFYKVSRRSGGDTLEDWVVQEGRGFKYRLVGDRNFDGESLGKMTKLVCIEQPSD